MQGSVTTYDAKKQKTEATVNRGPDHSAKPDSSSVGWSPSGVSLEEGASTGQFPRPDPSSVGWSPSGVSLGEGASTDRLSKPDPSSVGRSPSGVSLGDGAVGGSSAGCEYTLASDVIDMEAKQVLSAAAPTSEAQTKGSRSEPWSKPGRPHHSMPELITYKAEEGPPEGRSPPNRTLVNFSRESWFQIAL